MREVWSDIKEWEGMYQVSNLGNVKSLRYKRLEGNEHNLKPVIVNKNYVQVTLYRKGRRLRSTVHKLVLEAFDSVRKTGMECRHLNGNGLDNRLVNLKWGTPKENTADKVKHGVVARGSAFKHTKLKENEVWLIKKLIANNIPVKDIAKMFKVVSNTIGEIKSNRNWKWVKYP